MNSRPDPPGAGVKTSAGQRVRPELIRRKHCDSPFLKKDLTRCDPKIARWIEPHYPHFIPGHTGCARFHDIELRRLRKRDSHRKNTENSRRDKRRRAQISTPAPAILTNRSAAKTICLFHCLSSVR